jgi:hypothetical protein
VAKRSRWAGRIRRNGLLAFTLVSLVFWIGWVALRTLCNPAGDLSCGLYSDHYSHMNTARLFVSKGVSIWTQPLADSGRPLTPEEFATLPADLRQGIGGPDPSKAVTTLPGWPEDKPFVSTWANHPRFHPPGNMLLTAPAALLYSFTGLSFTGANKLLIILFVLYAHGAFYAFVKAGQLESWAKPVGFAAAAIVYSELIHWSLEGFYEALVLIPLVLSARFLAQRRGIESLLAFSVASVLHFRAFFFAPLAVYALYLIVRELQWKGWGRRQHVQLIAVAILSSISLGIFGAVSPYFAS